MILIIVSLNSELVSLLMRLIIASLNGNDSLIDEFDLR